MKLAELDINMEQLQRIAANPTPARAAPGQGRSGARGRGGTYVSTEVIVDAQGANPGCRCEELGLRAGMPVIELVELGSGCTGQTIDGRKVRAGQGGWVCNALDTIRRRYGL